MRGSHLMRGSERGGGGGMRGSISSVATFSDSFVKLSVQSDTLKQHDTPNSRRGRLRSFLGSGWYGFFICSVVMVDSLLIGLEQSSRLERADTSRFQHLETSFVAFYLLELMAVLYAYGLRALRSSWVRLDCFLVGMGLTSQFLIYTKIGGHLGESALLLRMVRMLRLARTYRVLVRFRELWMLAHGFINSVKILFHTLALGIVILYVYGCVAMELIPLSLMEGKAELSEELQRNVMENFGTLPKAMLTLVQFVTFDNPSNIYRPWLTAVPTMAWFFISALLVMGVVFMNLVTAVIVNRAMESAMQDQDMQRAFQEKKRNALLRSLEEAFDEADSNGSGELSREELDCISQERKAQLCALLGSIDLLKLFDYLDVDGDGSIGIEEFCVGIESIVHSDTRLEIKRMERIVESMRKQLKEVARTQKRMATALSVLAPSDGGELDAKHFRSSEFSALSVNSTYSMKSASSPPDFNGCSLPAWANAILLELKELAGKLDEIMTDNSIGPAAPLSETAQCVPGDAVTFQDDFPSLDASRTPPEEPQVYGGSTPVFYPSGFQCSSEEQPTFDNEPQADTRSSPAPVPPTLGPTLFSLAFQLTPAKPPKQC